MATEQAVAAPIAALSIAAVSPWLGQYVTIGLAATGGALWTISLTSGLAARAQFWMFFRAVSIAAFFSSIAAHYLSTWLNQPVTILLGPTAFAIAWVGDRWTEFGNRAFQGLLSLFTLGKKEKP